MTVTRLRRGFVGALLSLAVPAVIALPTAAADPQCDTTVGDSVSQYLDRHPDVKKDLTSKAQAESPGSPNALLDYLNRHPDVRQALITLSQQCVS